MKHYLLLGAGFSHNWGGWLASEAFEYLLSDSAVIANPDIRDLLWRYQPTGGFEAALDEIQRQQSVVAKSKQATLLSAIARMFAMMNKAFASAHLEFGEWIGSERPVRDFLVRFDALFSLNQDLLLEHCYRGTADGLVDRTDPRAWRSWQLPGMRLAHTGSEERFPSEAGIWVPSAEHIIEPMSQPIFKLHGSSNWRDQEGSEVMILGGAKATAIQRFPVLSWYADVFRSSLFQPGARLMIIGYGFRDGHINAALESAVDAGLKVFIIDPKGAYAGDAANPLPTHAIGYQPTSIQQKLTRALIGASRRPLSSTLARDSVERQKLESFFLPS